MFSPCDEVEAPKARKYRMQNIFFGQWLCSEKEGSNENEKITLKCWEWNSSLGKIRGSKAEDVCVNSPVYIATNIFLISILQNVWELTICLFVNFWHEIDNSK